jgi:hypothetical protein
MIEMFYLGQDPQAVQFGVQPPRVERSPLVLSHFELVENPLPLIPSNQSAATSAF